MRVVTFGSMFEETPEGLYRMDRIRRYEEARRRGLSAAQRGLEDRVEAAIERSVLFGSKEKGPAV